MRQLRQVYEDLQLRAFYKDDNRKVHYDVDKCWGCTICAPNCPKHAIHLLPREQKS